MNIVLVNRGAYGGGAETAVRGLEEMLKKMGHKVMLYTLPREETEETPVARSLFARAAVFLAEWLNFIKPLHIARTIRRMHPDIIHTHNLRGMGMWLPIFIRILKGRARWLHTAHDIQLVYPSGVALYPLLERNKEPKQKTPIFHDRVYLGNFFVQIYAGLQRMLWGSPDIVISPSHFLRAFYEKYHFFRRSAWRIIPNVLPYGERKIEEGGDKERRSLLFIGVLEPSKGAHILVDAFQKFVKENPSKNLTLDIVGDGSLSRHPLLAEERRGKGSGKITFHGTLSQDEIQRLFAQALVTVVPSLTYENAPTAILESYFQGVPVIASRIGGIPEYVEEGITGWLVEPGSSDELIIRLRLILNSAVREGVGRDCIRKSVDFNVAAFQGYLSLYQ